MKSKRFFKYYDIAGVKFCVETEMEYKDAMPYRLFLTEHNYADIYFRFQNVKELPVSEGEVVFENSYVQVVYGSNRQYRLVSCDIDRKPYACTLFRKEIKDIPVYLNERAPKIWDGVVFESIGLEHLLNQYGKMVLHAAYISVQNQAILFTAPSGTGKTTQAKLWERYKNAEIINGDRVCLSVEEDIVFAHGLPIAGTSKVCKNQSMHVKTIVVLEQAKENSIEVLTEYRAFRKLYSETWVNDWNHEDVIKVVDLIRDIINRVPILLLKCKPSYSAVQLLDEYMSNLH